MGLTFVKGHPDARPPEIPVTPPNEKANQTNFHLSQVESIDSSNTLKTPVVKKEKVEDYASKAVKTEIRTTEKKRKSKEKRQERLLKYQEKLMKTNGLPPSRLMEEQRLGQESSSVLGEFKRNLSNEFEFLAGFRTVHDTGPSLPTPGITPSHGPALPVLMPGQVVHLQPLIPMPGWSEARPEGGIGGGQSFPGVNNGSDSGLLNQPSLPSMTHSSVGWKTSEPVLVYHQPQYLLQQIPQSTPMMPEPQYLPQPIHQFPTPLPESVTPGGRPAYCFHCLQYGAVYSISPVC
jgi:hypothetical protein